MPLIERLPRDKIFALSEMGVRGVTFLKDYDYVLHVTVREMYLEDGAVNRPTLKPLHGAVNGSICPQDLELVQL